MINILIQDLYKKIILFICVIMRSKVFFINLLLLLFYVSSVIIDEEVEQVKMNRLLSQSRSHGSS